MDCHCSSFNSRHSLVLDDAFWFWGSGGFGFERRKDFHFCVQLSRQSLLETPNTEQFHGKDKTYTPCPKPLSLNTEQVSGQPRQQTLCSAYAFRIARPRRRGDANHFPNPESCTPSPNICRAPNRGGGSPKEEQTYIIPKILNPESASALTLSLNPEQYALNFKPRRYDLGSTVQAPLRSHTPKPQTFAGTEAPLRGGGGR